MPGSAPGKRVRIARLRSIAAMTMHTSTANRTHAAIVRTLSKITPWTSAECPWIFDLHYFRDTFIAIAIPRIVQRNRARSEDSFH
jgi:hypothetical protein